jgi:hypothetical protein
MSGRTGFFLEVGFPNGNEAGILCPAGDRYGSGGFNPNPEQTLGLWSFSWAVDGLTVLSLAGIEGGGRFLRRINKKRLTVSAGSGRVNYLKTVNGISGRDSDIFITWKDPNINLGGGCRYRKRPERLLQALRHPPAQTCFWR